MVFLKISTQYEQFYLGFIDPIATPSQWSYPMVCGGSANEIDKALSDIDNDHHAFWNGNSINYTSAKILDSDWFPLGSHYPILWAGFEDLIGNEIDTVSVFPIEAYSMARKLNYGRYYGLYAPIALYRDGEEVRSVISEATLADSSEAYIVFQDITRIGQGNLCAARLS